MFEELAQTCWVQVAATAAVQRELERAERACGEISAVVWRDECFFRVGEELGKQGRLRDSLAYCARAGRYSQFCLIHLGSYYPADLRFTSGDTSRVEGAYATLLTELAEGLSDATPAFREDAREFVLNRFWFNLYYGSGQADPTVPRDLAAEDAQRAHWGFALEAVRLLLPELGADPVGLDHRVRAIWGGNEAAPVGPALRGEQRHGRYHPPLDTPLEIQVPTLPTYGGGRRLVGASIASDLTVCVLEGLYYDPQVDGAVFPLFLEDKSMAVRWTAARLTRVTPSVRHRPEQVLKSMLTHTDVGVVQHAKLGLENREWERFTGPDRGKGRSNLRKENASSKERLEK